MKKFFVLCLFLIILPLFIGCATLQTKNDEYENFLTHAKKVSGNFGVTRHIQVNQSRIIYEYDSSRETKEREKLLCTIDVGEPVTIVFPRNNFKAHEIGYYCGLDNNQMVFLTSSWPNGVSVCIKFPKDSKVIKISNWEFNVVSASEINIVLEYLYNKE